MENQLKQGRIGNISYNRQDLPTGIFKAIIRSPEIDDKGHEVGYGDARAKIECTSADLPMFAAAEAMQQEILDTRHELKGLANLLPMDSDERTVVLTRFRNLGAIYHQSKGDLNPGLSSWKRLEPKYKGVY